MISGRSSGALCICGRKLSFRDKCAWCGRPLCWRCKCDCQLAQPNSTPMNPKRGGIGPVVEPKP